MLILHKIGKKSYKIWDSVFSGQKCYFFSMENFVRAFTRQSLSYSINRLIRKVEIQNKMTEINKCPLYYVIIHKDDNKYT